MFVCFFLVKVLESQDICCVLSNLFKYCTFQVNFHKSSDLLKLKTFRLIHHKSVVHCGTDLDLKWHGPLVGQTGSRAPPPPAGGSLVPASSGRVLTHRSPHATHLLQLLAMLGGGHWTCGSEKEHCIPY